MGLFTSRRGTVPILLGITLGLLLVTALLPVGVTAKLDRLSEESLRDVSGRTGIAFRLNDWRIDGGDASLELEGGVGSLTVGDFRVFDPDGIPNPFQINDNFGPYGDDPGNRLESGTFNNPFLINATDAGSGRVTLDFPNSQAAFEAADIQMSLQFDGTPIGNLVIGNALWAGDTRFAMGIRPEGGINLGIAIQLDGDVWYSAETNGSFDNGGLHIEGVFGGSNYTCSLPTVNDSCFSGALTWADLDANRPLKVDFGYGSSPRQVRIERVRTSSGGQGTIGINSLEFDPGGFNLGTTVIDSVNIRHFSFTGP
jgi:hypothetical protein